MLPFFTLKGTLLNGLPTSSVITSCGAAESGRGLPHSTTRCAQRMNCHNSRQILLKLAIVLTIVASGVDIFAYDQIHAYSIPKEQPFQPAAQTQQPKVTPDIPVNSSPIRWTVPDGWQQLPPDGIRLGNFSVTGKNGGVATVAITSFPGEVGTELDNVNRWRTQLGMEPVEQNGISSTPVTVDSVEGKLYDLAGTTARTVVALVRRDGAAWFFKMTGDAATVSEAKPAFLEFLKSIHFAAAGGEMPMAAATTPPATASEAAPAADDTSPKWNIPSNWVEKPAGAMLFKSFSIADNSGGSGIVTISFFGGAVGGTLANVNRWRGQMGLDSVEDAQLAGATATLDTAAGKATSVDIEGSGEKAGQRLVAVIVPHGDNTWFYKLLGEKTLVAKEKDSFVNFVKTVQYPQ